MTITITILITLKQSYYINNLTFRSKPNYNNNPDYNNKTNNFTVQYLNPKTITLQKQQMYGVLYACLEKNVIIVALSINTS